MELKKVKEYKHYVLCYCPSPNHHDQHPSCILWKDSNRFKCMACDFSGVASNNFSSAFELPEFDNNFEYFSPSQEVKEYIGSRGVRVLPSFLVSTKYNDGVGFLQRNINGDVIGIIQRLFTPFNKSTRYIYEGKKAPFTGDIEQHYKSGSPIIVIEKVFGMMRALTISQEKNLDVVVLSSNGVNISLDFWTQFSLSSVAFVMDNDIAGQRTRDRLKQLGYKAFCSKLATDEISDSLMEELILNVKSLLLRR